MRRKKRVVRRRAYRRAPDLGPRARWLEAQNTRPKIFSLLELAIRYVGILMILKNRGTDFGRPVTVTICNNLQKIEILDREMVGAVGKRSSH
jgi:hypothetical protein